MSYVAIEGTLTAEHDVTDLDDLAIRLDSVHDALTSSPYVLSADIIADGGHEIHTLVNFVTAEDESDDLVAARGESIIFEAFKAGKIETTDAVREGSLVGARVKEFALV